jgi:hypothetical protein
MTHIEELVWAAAFACAWTPRSMKKGQTFQDWTKEAVKIADSAVWELRSLQHPTGESKRPWQGWDMRSSLRAFAGRLRPFKMDVVEDMERLANEIADDDPKVWREAIEAALGVEADPENHTPEWAFSAVKERG